MVSPESIPAWTMVLHRGQADSSWFNSKPHLGQARVDGIGLPPSIAHLSGEEKAHDREAVSVRYRALTAKHIPLS
jgi:hypothetical protein